jgi:hypothetical protein
MQQQLLRQGDDTLCSEQQCSIQMLSGGTLPPQLRVYNESPSQSLPPAEMSSDAINSRELMLDTASLRTTEPYKQMRRGFVGLL